MVKVLNLDELEVDSGRAIIVNDKQHDMKLFSTGDFIRTLKAAEKASKGDAESMESIFVQMVEMIDRAFPHSRS